MKTTPAKKALKLMEAYLDPSTDQGFAEASQLVEKAADDTDHVAAWIARSQFDILADEVAYGQVENARERMNAIAVLIDLAYDESPNPPREFEIADFIPPVEGFDLRSEWNGWACPAFTLEQGQRLVDEWNHATKRSEHDGAYYDDDADEFVFFTGPYIDEEERFGRNENGLFEIGAFAWTWEVA